MATKTKLQLEVELKEARETIAALERELQKTREEKEAKPRADTSQGEEDFLKLLEILPVGISILNHERKVVFQNSALSQILDMSEEGIQAGAYKNRKYLASDGTEMPADGFASIQAQKSGHVVYNVETGIIKENGETIWTNVSALPVNFPNWETVIVTTDVTERKKLEVRTHEAELLYRTIFETSLYGLTVFDPKMNIMISNQRAAQIYGFDSPASMVGKNAFEFMPPEEQVRAREIAHNRRSDTAHYDEFRLLKQNGEEFIAETGSIAIPNQDGTPSGLVLGVVRDITEHKLLENKLFESEQRYNLLFQKSAVPSILLKLPEVVIIDVNEACEKLTGFNKQEMLGKTAAELGIIKQEQRTEAISHFEKHGSLAERETRAYTKSGEERIVVANTNQVMINGQPHAITTILDITGRKHAELKQQQLTERFNLATRSARLGIWDWDIVKNEIVWDDQMYALYGLKPGEFGGAYEAWLHGVHPEDRDSSNEVSTAAVRGEREYDTEFRVVWPDGSVHWLKANGKVFYDKAGTPLRMVGINFDITERKQSEQKLRESEVLLRQVLESNPDSTFAIDLNYRFLVDNQRHQQELIASGGKPFKVGEEILSPDYPPEVLSFWRAAYDRALAGETFSLEGSWFDTNGQLHIHENRFSPLHDAADQIIGALVVAHDITERKQAEEKIRESEEFLRLAYEATNLGVWKNDLVTGSVEFDERASMHYGFDTQQTTLPELMTHIHPDDVARLGAEIAAVTGPTGDGKFATEYRVIHPDGSVHWLAIGVRVIFEGEGEKRHSVMGYGTSLDITERKLTDEALKKSQAQLEALVTSLDDIVFEVDKSGTYLNLWTGNEALLFRPREEIIGKRFDEVFGEAASRPFFEFLELTLSSNAAQTLEYPVEMGGEQHWYAAHYNIIHVQTGMPQKVSILVRDITARKQAEETLRQSQESFAKAFSSNPTALAITRNVDGKFININDAYTSIMGYDRLEVIDHTALELSIYADPKEREGLLRVLAEQGRVLNYELSVQSKDKKQLEILVSMEPITYNNEDCILSAFVDITELKQAQQDLISSQKLLQSIIDNTPALVYTLDKDGCFLLINRPLEKLFGHTNAEMIGHGREDFVPSELAQQHRDNDLEIFQSGEGKIFEEENMEPDGRHVYLTTKFPLRDANGNIYAVCGISTDMTERKLMEEELRRSNAELEQFAYIASHDLQEPLRALSGMVQLLQKRYQGKLDERADEYIQHAVEASARMQALIQALLTYSRTQRSTQPIELVDAGQCLQTSLKNLHASIQETRTVVTTDPLPHVHADPVQLTQLFQNLIGNGIKFRGDAEPQIHISATKLSDAWQFSVRDNGIGIEPQYYERIFLIFQRLHTRREYPGTGIGLALCKKIIERHGGRIWVESEPQRGTTFYFTLPLRSHL